MEKLNFSQIIEKVKEAYGESLSQFAYNDTPSYPKEFVFSEGATYKQKSLEYFNSIGLGEMVEVSQYGGEGQGETWYSVKYFPEHDVYIKVTGFYTSYDGTDFDGWGEEVKPKEKLITVYE